MPISPKKLAWRFYLVVIHASLVVVTLMLVLAVSVIRSDRRLPGSRLAATFSDENGSWSHIIKHDGRDPVVGVIEKHFGVNSIIVSPPDSSLVWRFSRDEGEPWKLFIADYASPDIADRHMLNPDPVRDLMDGSEFGPLDGLPDASFTYSDESIDYSRITGFTEEFIRSKPRSDMSPEPQTPPSP